MNKFDNTNTFTNKQTDQHRSVQSGFIDIHCHCLNGVDDGPTTIYDSLALCQSLVDDGITTVIATPHQLGQFEGCNHAEDIRRAVLALNQELENRDIPLTVLPGGDVRLDERICQMLKADKILTLGDNGRYILLELPFEVIIDIEPLLVELSYLGIQAIISHPERRQALSMKPVVISKWLRHSASLQVTAGSLLGDFGHMAYKAAWYFLSSGWVSMVATDSHNLSGRRTRMRAAFYSISRELGQATARQVCIENPLRVLEARKIAPALIHKHKGLI